jgi:hypothetical protein
MPWTDRVYGVGTSESNRAEAVERSCPDRTPIDLLGWSWRMSSAGGGPSSRGGRGFEPRRPLPGGLRRGGRVARQRPAKPCTAVQFRSPPLVRFPSGRLAQRESASLTRKRSEVQILQRPQLFVILLALQKLTEVDTPTYRRVGGPSMPPPLVPIGPMTPGGLGPAAPGVVGVEDDPVPAGRASTAARQASILLGR